MLKNFPRRLQHTAVSDTIKHRLRDGRNQLIKQQELITWKCKICACYLSHTAGNYRAGQLCKCHH